jgi:tetratricopeptide (TPR) repeat protein
MITAYENRYESAQELIADGEHEKAILDLEQLVAEHVESAEAHFDLGNLYYSSGRMEQALMHYEETVSLQPDNPLYLKNLADLLYSECKETDRALNLYEKILSLNPEDVQTLMVTGHLCVSLKRFDEALAHYNQILDLEPWNVEAQQFIERLVKRDGIRETEENPESIYQQCQGLVDRGHIEKAISCLESLSSEHPDFALAHNDLGVLYYQQGDMKRCQLSYERAVSIEPANPNFQKNLADFYLVEKGNVEQALEIYMSVLNDNPEDIDTLMAAGHVSAAIGNADSARLFYDRVLDVEPWNLEASECLGKL